MKTVFVDVAVRFFAGDDVYEFALNEYQDGVNSLVAYRFYECEIAVFFVW